MTHPIDIIGDIHGELPALEALLAELGYAQTDDWRHPDSRFLVFLGDLIDRGGHSLEVAELVMRLCDEGRAACIMGNHEYNLVSHVSQLPGFEKPKRSNRGTVEQMRAHPDRWRSVLEFFRSLPLSIELPDLRVAHACWHVPSVEAIGDLLSESELEGWFSHPEPGTPAAWLATHIRHHSPFDADGWRPGLPPAIEDQEDRPHEIFMKGFEVPADPFLDNDGKERHRIREVWWRERGDVVTDRPQVFGHYWNVPPVDGERFCPPEPSGHPALRQWQRELMERYELVRSGSVAAEADAICVDFQGVTQVSSTSACVGGLRWPERRVAWASGRNTRRPWRP